MKRHLVLLIVTPLFASGCDILFPPTGDPTGSSQLKRFESRGELSDYFLEQIRRRNGDITSPGGLGGFAEGSSPAPGDFNADSSTTDGAAPLTAPPGRSDSGTGFSDAAGDFSTTTIQEMGVDEADVVKTDGTFLYLISNNTLRIVQVTEPGEMKLRGEVSLEGFGRELYLQDGKVVALTETFGNLAFLDVGFGVALRDEPPASADGGTAENAGGGSDATVTADVPDVAPTDPAVMEPGIVAPDIFPPVSFTRPQTFVTIVDVTDPDNPSVLSQTAFDGSQASSRLIDGVLHLVIANVQDFFFDVVPRLGRPDLNTDEIDPQSLLPRYEQNDAEGNTTSGPLLTWQKMYRPSDPDGFGVLAVVSMNINQPESFRAVGIVAEPGLIYSSRDALYLTDTNYNFRGDMRETTDLYKLVYQSEGATPVATGTVPGRILNQYSMSEYNGYLRVATTVGPTFSFFGQRTQSHNNVYVLKESQGSLAVTGSVEDIAPRETIQSARFVGDKGFVVTFEQIDPLFTLDLSDPADPRIVGELKVPGFSTFLVPLDEDHLLAVGQFIPDGTLFGPRGVQLSLFDVSDFANPVLSHQVVLSGPQGAWSEALSNPKAFTFFASQNLVALPLSVFDNQFFLEVDNTFAMGEGSDSINGSVVNAAPSPADSTVPAAVTADDSVAPLPPTSPQPIPPSEGFDGLAVFRVSTDAGFEELGRISARFDEVPYFTGSYTRGVFIGDNVFAVTDRGVRGAPVSDVSSPLYELVLPLPFPSPVPLPVDPVQPVDEIAATP